MTAADDVSDLDPVAIPAVDVRGVSRRFAPRGVRLPRRTPVAALTDVTMTVRRGSRFGIVGESGSGKTTLVRLIAALDEPSSGRILVNGVDITARAGARRRVARPDLHMVFQDPAGSLDPRMRVGTIVGEALRGASPAEATERVRQALLDVGLDGSAAAKYPHQFSGGQRQRISIARAIVGRPSILIADEAVSALDVTTQSHILALLASLTRLYDMTLLFVSHDLSVVSGLCDEIAVLRHGRVVESGQTKQIFAAPAHSYTRELLAAVPTVARSRQLALERRARLDNGHSWGEEVRT